VLTAEPRRLLSELCEQARTRIRKDVRVSDVRTELEQLGVKGPGLQCSRMESPVLDVEVSGSDCSKFESLVDLAVGFVASVPEPASHLPTTVLVLAETEPLPSVRAGHYRWLAGLGWNTLRVYRAAAADPDPAISAWGTSHLPPSGGMFR